MRVSIFCTFLLLSSLVLGCHDDVQGKQWDLAGDAGTSDGGADDGGIDLGPGDVGSDLVDDAGPVDVGRPDAGRDAASDDVGEDAGSGIRTATGWYSSAFEHSGFVADDGAGAPQVTIDEDNCSPYLMAETPTENWWTLGEVIDEARTTVTAGGSLSRMELTGELSARGMHGHLGGYDREFVVSDGRVLACETAAAAGHCVYPRADDVCVIPSVSVVSPDSEPDPYLTQTFGGVAESPTNYDLRITYDENVADGRTDVVVQWAIGADADAHVGVEDLDSVSLTVEEHGFIFREISYENLDGWVARSPTGTDAWMVSITGESSEDGSPLRVWGFFPVDETIALP